MLSSVVTVSLGRGVIACWINQCLSWNMCIFKNIAGCTILQCILVCPSLHNIVQKLNTIYRVVTWTKIWLHVKSLNLYYSGPKVFTGIQWKSNNLAWGSIETTGYCGIILNCGGRCLWIVKILHGNVISCLTGLLHYFIKHSWERKFMGMGNPWNPRTLIPYEQWMMIPQYVIS